MKHTLVGALLFITFLVNSQVVTTSKNFSYTLSEPYEVVDGIKSYFTKNGEVLSVKYGAGMFYFQKFSGKILNESKRVEVPKGEGFDMESFEEVNGHYYFFFSRWDKKNITEQLFVREIDFDKCNFAGPEKLLIKVKGKVTGGFSILGMGSGKFSFLKSFSEEMMIIQYRLKPENKNDATNNDAIGMHVYNETLEEVWSQIVEMPYSEKKMNNLAYTVDRDGNAYVLAEIFKDETTKRTTSNGSPNYRLEVIRVDNTDQSITTTELELKGKFITDVGFFEGKNGQLILAGYYGNKNNGGTDGLFMFNMDVNGEIAEAQSHEIPVDIMTKYVSERAKEKMEKKDDTKDLAMSNMVLREIVFDADGGVTLYGEKYYSVTTYNASTKTTTTTYYYQEILVARLEADGSLAWMNKLPKSQSGGAPRGGMGFYTLKTPTEDYVLFIDNIKNMELPLDKFPARHSDGQGGYLTGFKVDKETGDLEKVSLFDLRDAKGIELFQFNTGRIIQLSDNEFAVECYKKKKEDVMIKVTLKK